MVALGCASPVPKTIDTTAEAFMVSTRVQTPDNRLMYTSVLDSLEHGRIDLGNAYELSGLSRAFTHGGKVFQLDGESGEITRYVAGDGGMAVDTLDDGSEARLSMQGIGVTAFSSAHAFVDEQLVVSFDNLNLGQLVDWNPTDMTITRTRPMPEMVREDMWASVSRPLQAQGDRIIVGMSWADYITTDFVPLASMAVLDDHGAGALTLVDSDACTGGSSVFADGGKVHLVGDNHAGLTAFATDPYLEAPCLLSWSSGDSSFSGSPVDLGSLIDTEAVSGGLGRGDGTVIVRALDASVDLEEESPFTLYDIDAWWWVEVALDGSSARVVDDIPAGGVSAAGWVIDGAAYLPHVDSEAGVTTLWRLEADGSATEVLSVSGEIFELARIR
jgi:hypothetical protein